MPANAWLDRHARVQEVTWAPGEPEVIRNKLIRDGGWIPKPGDALFNLYRPPTIERREGNVEPWLALGRKLWPEDVGYLIPWFAHRVQRPERKPNQALVLGGAQRIGKDSWLEPIKSAVGPWNVAEVLAATDHEPLQQLRALSDPAHQRGARSRRARSLPVL